VFANDILHEYECHSQSDKKSITHRDSWWRPSALPRSSDGSTKPLSICRSARSVDDIFAFLLLTLAAAAVVTDAAVHRDSRLLLLLLMLMLFPVCINFVTSSEEASSSVSSATDDVALGMRIGSYKSQRCVKANSSDTQQIITSQAAR